MTDYAVVWPFVYAVGAQIVGRLLVEHMHPLDATSARHVAAAAIALTWPASLPLLGVRAAWRRLHREPRIPSARVVRGGRL